MAFGGLLFFFLTGSDDGCGFPFFGRRSTLAFLQVILAVGNSIRKPSSSEVEGQIADGALEAGLVIQTLRRFVFYDQLLGQIDRLSTRIALLALRILLELFDFRSYKQRKRFSNCLVVRKEERERREKRGRGKRKRRRGKTLKISYQWLPKFRSSLFWVRFLQLGVAHTILLQKRRREKSEKGRRRGNQKEKKKLNGEETGKKRGEEEWKRKKKEKGKNSRTLFGNDGLRSPLGTLLFSKGLVIVAFGGE